MKHFYIKLVFGLLIISVPSYSFAYTKIDTKSLNNERVEEIQVPVLFGVNLSSLIPDFGDLRGDGSRTHEGQDMRAPKGTPIISPTEAVVSKTGNENSAGKFVYTINPGGENFRYMHLDTIEVKVGDKLKKGNFIGTVGDTGNAPDGIYHLHFEIKNGKTPTDPYPRLVENYTLKEKVALLENIFDDIKNEDELAELLVTNFPEIFKEALDKNYDLPREIEIELEKQNITSTTDLLKTFNDLITKIPTILTMELKNGDESTAVVLLQMYLIYSSEGSARDYLSRTGATGYFGPITKASLIEYQTNKGIKTTGMYDTYTRLNMIK